MLVAASASSLLLVGTGRTAASVPDRQFQPASQGGIPMDTLQMMAAEFGKTVSISEDEAMDVFSDTKPLVDFLEKHRDDPAFGFIDLEYAPDYSIVIRQTDGLELSRTDLDLLTNQLSRRPVLTQGGASYSSVIDLSKEASDRGLRFRQNLQEGTIDLFSDSPVDDEFEAQTWVRRLDERTPQGFAATGPHSGLDVKYWFSSQWQSLCTSGFMWGGYGIVGYATAAHCVDPPSYNGSKVGSSLSGVATATLESCSTTNNVTNLDVEMTQFAVLGDQSESFDAKNSYTSSPVTVYAVAGGFVGSQPTYKVGRTAATTNWGEAHGFETATAGWIDECGGFLGLSMAFRTHNGGAVGDSGGPTYLLYNGAWYLASIASIASSSNTWGTWVNWIPMPNFNSIHICTYVNPCN